MIDCNDWVLRNNLNIPIPIADLPVDLHELFVVYSTGRLVWFYYRLGEFGIYSFLNGENNYFNEND